MSRRNISKKRFPEPDSIYNSYLVSLLISRILKSGKKTIAKNHKEKTVIREMTKGKSSEITQDTVRVEDIFIFRRILEL